MRSSKFKSGLAAITLAVGAALTPKSEATPIINQDHIAQGDSGAIMYIGITNDDNGTEYDSVVGKIGDLTAPMLDKIIEHNPAYSDATHQDLLNYWDFNVSTESELDGWSASLGSNDLVEMTHVDGIPNTSYDVWYSTSENSSQDYGVLAVKPTFDQLDFNRNGIFDSATESIYKTEQLVPDAFTPTSRGYELPSASANSYDINVIPEPGAGLMLGLGAIVALASQRLLRRRKH